MGYADYYQAATMPKGRGYAGRGGLGAERGRWGSISFWGWIREGRPMQPPGFLIFRSECRPSATWRPPPVASARLLPRSMDGC